MTFGTAAIRRTVAPAALPITRDQVKAHCNLDGADWDAYLDGLIEAAVGHVDGQGVLGRAMVTQTWAQWVSQSPGWVRLTMGPFISLVSVEYYNSAGDLLTADLADFETRLSGDDVICKPKTGRQWPTSDARSDAIKISYTAGFGGAADVPANIRHALLMIVAHWFENREATSEKAKAEMPLAVDALLGAERVKWFG